MTNARLAGIFYVVMALLTALFTEQLLRVVWRYGEWSDPELLGAEWTLTTAIGFSASIIAALVIVMNRTSWAVSLEIAQELRKVTWPGWAETKSATLAVIVVSVIVAIFLGVFDLGWKWITDFIYEAPTRLG